MGGHRTVIRRPNPIKGLGQDRFCQKLIATDPQCGPLLVGIDLTGAKELELWARGEYGGERINIGVGLLGADKAHPDSAKRTVEDIVLTSEWKRYRIRLKRLDLSSIKTGFVIVLSGKRVPVAVYLDSIRFVR